MNNCKIKICHVASVDITVKFLLLPQLKFLAGQGYDVSAVCSDGKWVKDIEAQGIRVKTIKIKRKISPFSDLVSLVELFLYFRKEKFQIVHVHTPKPGLLGQLAAKMAGVPVIINTVHGLYFVDSSSVFRKKFFIFAEKIAAKCSSLIFSQNKEDIRTMVDEKISRPDKIKYLGNGIDIARFNLEKFSEEFILEKKKNLGIEGSPKIIGIVGRLVREKGYLELFEAFKSVLEKYPEAILLIIGPEDREKKDTFSPEIIKNYGIDKNVIFLGERTDLEELYALMDIFILPSHREGFPRTIIEAMAMERPIIATDIRGCREAIENKKNGILVPVGDSKKIAENMLFLLDNPQKSKELAENAKGRAVEEFDEKLVFSRISEEYRRLLKKKIKICHVSTVDITARFILLNFLRFLKNEGYQVHMVCSFLKWEQFFKDEGFFTKDIKMTRRITIFHDIVSFVKLLIYFKKEKFDIVHTHTPKAGILGRVAAKVAGVPVVVHTNHGLYLYDEWPLLRRNFFTFFERIGAYCSNMIFSVNKEDISMSVKEKICKVEKIKYSGEGIDVKRFDPARFPSGSIDKKKSEIGIGADKKVIGIVGRLVKEKGYQDLFDAFRIIVKKIPEAILLVIGQEEREKEDYFDLDFYSKRYKLEKNVIFLGERTDVEELYPLMDVFVLPSHREGLGLVILEASAMKRPVVATDIRGCRESVENGKTGILVSAKNPGKLAEVVINILNNLDKTRVMGELGRMRVLREFNEKDIFGKMKEDYDSLMKQKNR